MRFARLFLHTIDRRSSGDLFSNHDLLSQGGGEKSQYSASLRPAVLRIQAVQLLFIPLIGLTACQAPPSEPIRSASPTPTDQPRTPAAQPAVATPQVATPQPSDKTTIPLTLYKLDNQCNKFVSEKIRVSKTKTLERTIGRVLETVDSADFSLVGYRVSVAKGVATIDFRTDPSAKRQLKSLSNCEQLALYGSLRKTLTENKTFKIKSVRFTDRGQLIKP